MDLPKTEALLRLNNIDLALFDEKLSNTLLLGVFEALCKDIKKQGTRLVEREKFLKRTDKTIAAKSLVSRYIGCELADEEYSKLARLLSAYFSTGDPRKQFDLPFRRKLIEQQDSKCAICNKTISLENSHVDHIIPWDYVGDCLKDNYQMLCETCNTRKGNSTFYEMSMLLLNRKDTPRS